MMNSEAPQSMTAWWWDDDLLREPQSAEDKSHTGLPRCWVGCCAPVAPLAARDTSTIEACAVFSFAFSMLPGTVVGRVEATGDTVFVQGFPALED